jgi:glycosyltransferase involved in cell wall biosynthesis
MHTIETGGTGGAETVYLDLIRRLDRRRWNHVAVLPTKEWMYEQLTQLGVEPILMRENRSFDLVFFARMVRLIRKLRVDLIHAHLFGSAVHAALLSRVCNVPAIATIHGAIDLKPDERLRSFKVATLNHGLEKVVFVSEGVKRAFLSSIDLRRDLATVITNGVDASRFSSGSGDDFRRELGIGPDEFVVGTVSTPGRAAKGLDVLLDAVVILKTLSPGCRFVVVGDLDLGRGTEFLRERDSRGLSDNVLATGFRNDVNCALAAFDTYALTSRSEGFPLSLLEAMASGLPIVATRCGGPEEIIEDGVTGILVENESAEAIARAIARLRQDVTERRRLSDAASKAVSERFTLDVEIRAYEKIYESCLSGARDIARPALESRTQDAEG